MSAAASSAGTARIGWVDEARGIGILLVVVGHTLPGLWNAGLLRDAGPPRLLVDWIYTFHMPLFFLLSGLFAARAAVEPYRALVAGKLRTIAWPYLVWSILQTLMQLALAGLTNRTASPWSLLTVAWLPIMQFWFLYALFLIFLIVGALQRLGAGPGLVAAFAVGLYSVPHWGSLGPWGVAYSVANHMLYFAAGMLVAARLPGWLAQLTPARAGLAMVAGFGATAAAALAGVQHGVVRTPVLALAGSAATLVLAASLARRGWTRAVAYCGRSSLQIYVGHSMASAAWRIALQRGLGVTALAPHLLGGLAVGVCAPLALSWLCDRTGFRWAFSWPKPRAASVPPPLPARAVGAAGPALVVVGTLAMAAVARALSGEPVRVEIGERVVLRDVRRIGVNLGSWRSWGAEQLGSNVLQNPGFEGTIDRAIVVVAAADAGGFSDDQAWLGRADGFWAGATYDVRSGRAAGARGHLVDSHRAGAGGLPRYVTDGAPPPLAPGDVVALTRVDDAGPAERWRGGARLAPALGEVRPGSPGRRALALLAAPDAPAVVSYYLDAIGDRAGKLLPVAGRWRLAFWSRAAAPGLRLRVRFARAGSPPFLERELRPDGRWRQTVFEFEGHDDGPAGTLELRFEAVGDGRVLLDDAELGAAADAGGPFRAAVIATLTRLRPGYLRDWTGAQGETFANRLAPAAARRVTRSSPAAADTYFDYALTDFLDLCRGVGADPWLVVPTTFSDRELARLGHLLAGRAARDRFDEVVVEFGNENWNPLSRPAGIPDPRTAGAAAMRAFDLLRAAADGVPLRAAVNGQFANPRAALAAAAAAPRADLLAVAPYLLFALPAGLSPAQRLVALFPDDGVEFAPFAASPLPLAVAEINLHTTGGDAPDGERDAVVASAAAGTALARRILAAQAAGAVRQCAYALAGYENFTADGHGFVKLWGLTRDLGPTRRLRPTGLAVALLNHALAGDRLEARVHPSRPDLTAAAFRTPAGVAVVIASGRAQPTAVDIVWPAGATAVPARLLTLVAADPWATNERNEAVRLVATDLPPAGRTLSLWVPAAALLAVVPAAA